MKNIKSSIIKSSEAVEQNMEIESTVLNTKYIYLKSIN